MSATLACTECKKRNGCLRVYKILISCLSAKVPVEVATEAYSVINVQKITLVLFSETRDSITRFSACVICSPRITEQVNTKPRQARLPHSQLQITAVQSTWNYRIWLDGRVTAGRRKVHRTAPTYLPTYLPT